MIDFLHIGPYMPRPRGQRGELSEFMPKRGKLARGRFWARWRVYQRKQDGTETSKRVERIIDRDVAEESGLILNYAGPLTKTDAWKVLASLIQGSNAKPAGFRPKMTFGELAREYIDLNKPNWEGSTARVNTQLIETHLIGRLGPRLVLELAEPELQRFLNGYVEQGSSKSLLSKLVLFLRAILDTAVERGLLERNPARKLRAKSRKRSSNLAHTLEECDLLLAQVSGADHLAIRLLIQLGLRSEELFALRRNDVHFMGRGAEEFGALTLIGDPHSVKALHHRADCDDPTRQINGLLIDEAIVDGQPKATKTLASNAMVYLTPDLAVELQHYLGMIAEDPEAWLFPSRRRGVPIRPGNFLNRVLKPAAVRAGICVRRSARGEQTSALNFQSLRRTSATLFGSRAKDPKSTQAHMRHVDPQVTLSHYQQAIPSEVKAAAMALERDLLEERRRRESKQNSAGIQ